MFHAEPRTRFHKLRVIDDDASDMRLYLDVDDVDPADVSDDNVERIERALNGEFYDA